MKPVITASLGERSYHVGAGSAPGAVLAAVAKTISTKA
jgi:hypothetical protein